MTGPSPTDPACRTAFDVVLHPLVAGSTPGPVHADTWGSWPTIVVPRAAHGGTTTVGFDEALSRLDALGRAFVEPDGAFVWVGTGGPGRWQVDGNAWERDGRIHAVDVRGTCPLDELLRLLAVWRGPDERLAVEILRAGIHLDEATFLRHALARGAGTAPHDPDGGADRPRGDGGPPPPPATAA